MKLKLNCILGCWAVSTAFLAYVSSPSFSDTELAELPIIR